MKFLVPLALLTVITVGSVLPVWLPLPLFPPVHHARAAQLTLSIMPVGTKAASAASQLLGFVSSPVAATAPSLLTDVYFYEGQYVRRGQVLAKLKVRPSNAVAYLNATHDGVLSRPTAVVGDLLSPQTPLATLTDQTRLLVRLHPTAARHLHPGDSVHVSLANTTAAAARGKITSWTASATTGPLLTLQLHRSLPGATVGSPLTVAATPPAGHPQVAATDKAQAAPKRLELVYSPALAQE